MSWRLHIVRWRAALHVYGISNIKKMLNVQCRAHIEGHTCVYLRHFRAGWNYCKNGCIQPHAAKAGPFAKTWERSSCLNCLSRFSTANHHRHPMYSIEVPRGVCCGRGWGGGIVKSNWTAVPPAPQQGLQTEKFCILRPVQTDKENSICHVESEACAQPQTCCLGILSIGTLAAGLNMIVSPTPTHL